MILKLCRSLLLAAAIVALFAVRASAQLPDASFLWITLNDHNGNVNTMYYGNASLATYCIDDGTNGTHNYFESIAPPPPPSGWDARWKGVRTTSGNACISDGLFPRDWRAVPSNPAKRDTFMVTFGNSDFPDSTVTITWPDPTYLAGRCDSMFMTFTDPCSGTPMKINMFTQNSVDIPSAYGGCGNTGANLNVKIFKFGCNTVDGVQDPPPVKKHIESYSLGQNYPNPFNPTTTLKFDILKTATADISVYNILGQKIATLVTGSLQQGEYTTVWNGQSQSGIAVPSGVYFVRMNARAEGTGEQFTAVRKILYMK